MTAAIGCSERAGTRNGRPHKECVMTSRSDVRDSSTPNLWRGSGHGRPPSAVAITQ